MFIDHFIEIGDATYLVQEYTVGDDDPFRFRFDFSGNGFNRWHPDLRTCIDHIKELRRNGDGTL